MTVTERLSVAAAVTKALGLLDLFAPPASELGLSEIARLSGMPKPTAHRLLLSLAQSGLVVQDPVSRGYRLGFRLVELGEWARQGTDLRRIAMPGLMRLRDQTGEAAHLGVCERGQAFYLEKVDSNHPLQYWTRLGQRIPLHAGAIGKVLGAFLPEAERMAIYGRSLPRYTDRTYITQAELEPVYAEIRKTGFCLSSGELFPDITSVAAPVFGPGGRMVAAISVGGPSGRFAGSVVQQATELLLTVCAQMSQQMGFAL